MTDKIYNLYDLEPLEVTGLTERDLNILGEAYEAEINLGLADVVRNPSEASITRGFETFEKILRLIGNFNNNIQADPVMLETGIVTFRCINKSGAAILVCFEPCTITKGRSRVVIIDALGAVVADYSIQGLIKDKIVLSTGDEIFTSSFDIYRELYYTAFHLKDQSPWGNVTNPIRLQYLRALRTAFIGSSKEEVKLPFKKDLTNENGKHM